MSFKQYVPFVFPSQLIIVAEDTPGGVAEDTVSRRRSIHEHLSMIKFREITRQLINQQVEPDFESFEKQ